MQDLAVVDSQNVGEDADTPQVGGGRDGLVGRHLGRRELRRAVLDVQCAGRAVAPRVAEVDHLQLVCRRAQQEQVLRLQQTVRLRQRRVSHVIRPFLRQKIVIYVSQMERLYK